MILEKQPLPDDPTPSEAPPSYDTVQTESSKYLLAEKPALDHPRSPSSSPSSTHSPSPPSPVFTKGHLYTRSNVSPGPSSSTSSTSPKSKGKSKSWFTFSPSRNSPEIRQTVLGLIRGLVRQPKPSPSYEALGVLESCAAACTNFNLSFSSLLQERFIEGHTPIYWAIIKRPAEPSSSSTSSSSPDDDGAPIPDFLTTLISFADPLTPETKSEIRLACLLTSDQPLFQRLRLLPEFSPLSGTDQILLGASMPPDGILVDDVPGDDEGLFVVHFEVVQFQQRMRVSKRVALEFIARGRMWCLSFSVTPASTTTNRRLGNPAAKPGSWCLTLALLEHSPPTWIDARLFIEEPRHNDSSASLLIDGASPKPKPTICFRLKTASTQLIAPSPSSSSESGSSKNSAADESQNEIVVSLDDSLMGSSLQYDRNSYIAQDGTLRARLEARLTKPQADCIIC